MSGFVDISCGVPSLMDALPFVVPGRDSHKTEIKIDAELYEEHSYGELDDEEDARYASHGAPLCFKQSDSEKLLSLCKCQEDHVHPLLYSSPRPDGLQWLLLKLFQLHVVPTESLATEQERRQRVKAVGVEAESGLAF